MVKKKGRVDAVLIVVMALLIIGPISSVVKAQTAEEIKARIEALEKKKRDIEAAKNKSANSSRPSGKSLEEIIARYEKLLESCAVKKSDRCADVMFTLGGLYYDQCKDAYIKAVEAHSEAMEQYERRGGRGNPPQAPVPDYTKSLKMYWQLAREYPTFPKLPEAYYQMGNTYLVQGALDTTRIIFQQLVSKFPNSPRASGANFRLGELEFMDHNMAEAGKYFERVKKNEVDIVTWEMVHYRRAEVAYNMGDFDKAVGLFHSYVEACDAGQYVKREFREMALEFMGISFSDMPDGGEEAIKFFKKVGSKPYEAQVLYTVGLKNRSHGQYDAAISSLQTALKRFPFYKDAPIARQMLVECYVIKKEYEKANEERVSLVDDYGPGSQWYSKNSTQKVIIDKANAEVRRALGAIAIYYHSLGQRTKDRKMYEKAKARYEEYFKKFPEDKWRVYEYKYNIAEIYNSMGDCQKAAENYDYVAMQDLSTYPAFVNEVDTLGMDSEEMEKIKAQGSGNKSNPVSISQEDAGYNVIVALDNCRKKEMAKEGLDDEKAYALPSTKKLLEYTEQFQKRFPKSSNASEVLYLAGNIHYSAKSYENAIRVFKQVTDLYSDSKIYDKSLRMLANSYSNANQFDMAMTTYKSLIAKTPANTNEYAEVIDLAAGAMYKQAENIKKSGNMAGAADAFKAIANQYMNSKVADRGWFEAGVCYEEMKDLDKAAATFEELTVKFPKSTIRENAFIRAAEDYKKNNKYDRAAQVYLTAANSIPKAEFAIPSLSSASEAYQKIEQYDMAGKMFELIYERYASDPKTPQALYNAGLIFEKGKLYTNAINVYDALAKRYPDNEFAAEAFFSIGLCYEKLDDFEKMAGVFYEYADKFTGDKYKQVQALVKAGDAYFSMDRFADAEKNYLKATKIYEQYKDQADIDVASIAKSFYKMGDIYYKKFQGISLKAKNEKEMKNLVKEKTKALEDPAKFYAKAIEAGVEEWTVRGTYMIGRGFYDMADAVANQTLFGNQMEQIAGKIRILSSLEKYYEKAMEYFYQNITWAKTQNIKGEYIEKSMDALMEMAYLKGKIFIEVGLTFRNSPIPPDLSEEEKQYYIEALEEKYLQSLDAALPKFEEAIRIASDVGIANSAWIDSVKEKITMINPSSDMLNVDIKEWKPSEVAPQLDSAGNVIAQKPKDADLERNLKRIANIMNMNIPFDEKMKQLNRIEMEAQRNIILEEEKINELKAKKGS